ncbi:hypothetical protein NDU88_003192 [Pleurodeles waltl]|uniref:Uncharacterized protein n=1 Tax=Pleurodeles waltl TaxID=8319 RepID=A0AAV7UD21_PLEWA|nr:hypothetical protein NDU88_003192 [Pleurodeles waltl]
MDGYQYGCEEHDSGTTRPLGPGYNKRIIRTDSGGRNKAWSPKQLGSNCTPRQSGAPKCEERSTVVRTARVQLHTKAVTGMQWQGAQYGGDDRSGPDKVLLRL